jgi:hypothetical protein
MWATESETCRKAAQQTISETLRSEYEPILSERLPDPLTTLLERLEGSYRLIREGKYRRTP